METNFLSVCCLRNEIKEKLNLVLFSKMIIPIGYLYKEFILLAP